MQEGPFSRGPSVKRPVAHNSRPVADGGTRDCPVTLLLHHTMAKEAYHIRSDQTTENKILAVSRPLQRGPLPDKKTLHDFSTHWHGGVALKAGSAI